TGRRNAPTYTRLRASISGPTPGSDGGGGAMETARPTAGAALAAAGTIDIHRRAATATRANERRHARTNGAAGADTNRRNTVSARARMPPAGARENRRKPASSADPRPKDAAEGDRSQRVGSLPIGMTAHTPQPHLT